MQRVLVAGAGSFPGKSLAGYLSRQGYEVVGTACRPEEALGGSLLPWDPMRPFPAAGAFDAILHAEGCMPPHGEEPGIWEHKRRSIDLTERVLELARQQGARVIYLSSTEVHGEAQEAVLCEDSPRRNPSSFGLARYIGEELLRESGVPHIVLRLPEVLGPGAPEGWLSGTVRQILEHAEVRGGSPGTLVNSFVWIDDLAYFVEELLEMPRWRHTVVQLAAWRRTSLRALLEGIRKRIGSPSPIVWGSTAAPAPLLLDDSRAKEMGFASTGPMEIVRRILPAGISERLGLCADALREIDQYAETVGELCEFLMKYPCLRPANPSDAAGYERLWQSLRRRYRGICLEALDCFGISYMCFALYLHAFECPERDGCLHVFLPLRVGDSVPSRYLLRHCTEKMEIVSRESAPFWKHVLQRHGSHVTFSRKYWVFATVARSMDYRRIPFPKDFILNFSPSDTIEARRHLHRMGLAGRPYVCIYARGNSWNQDVGGGTGSRPAGQ